MSNDTAAADTTAADVQSQEPESQQDTRKVYERFASAARVVTQHDLGKRFEISPATIASAAISEREAQEAKGEEPAGIANFLVREGTDQMFWLDSEPWDTWAWLRAERKFNKQQERAKAEAEQVTKLAGTVAAHADSIDPAARAALLASLLSDEEMEALGLSK